MAKDEAIGFENDHGEVLLDCYPADSQAS
jgi:hypothetical protein